MAPAPLAEIYRRLGRQLKALREDIGMTQEALAERAEIGVSYLVKIEAGTRRSQVETLEALSKVMRVPLAALFPEPKPLPPRRTSASAARESGPRYQGPTLGDNEPDVVELAEVARELDRTAIKSLIAIARQLPRR